MKQISLYTDGACSGNPGRGGWSAVAFNEDDERILQMSGGFRHTTNNRMEIMAVTKGINGLMCKLLENLEQNRKNTDIKVTVYSDSQLVVNTMNLGWAKKTNADLWEELDNVLSAIKNARETQGLNMTIEYVKVKGHADDEKNNLADQIAVAASQPVNANGVDEYYEKIASAARLDIQETPVILSIKLKGHNTPKDRKVEVTLSNDTVVNIIPLYGGFQQCNCTEAESRITVDIAWKFQKWLNGGKL